MVVETRVTFRMRLQ